MSENKIVLSKHRLDSAKETMRSAEYNYDGGFYRDSINRAYYVVFYAIKAILALEGIDFKRHKDAIGYFNKNYVATGIFSRDLGKKLGRLKMLREESDYSDFFIASKDDSEKQYQAAEFIICEVKNFLEQRNILQIVAAERGI